MNWSINIELHKKCKAKSLTFSHVCDSSLFARNFEHTGFYS